MRRTAFLLFLLVGAAPAQAQASPQNAPPSMPIAVAQGSATVKRVPDRALVTVATETRAEQPAEAQSRNAEAMQKVRDRLRQAGIPEDAIRTVSFNLREEADFVEGKRVPRGYVVTNAIEVRVDELDRLGKLLDQVVSAGVTSIHGIQFELKKREEAEREALRLAVEDARARAEALAAGAGVRLQEIVRIEEHGDRGPTPPPRPMMRTMAAEADVSTPVAAGEIAIEVSVTLTARIAR